VKKLSLDRNYIYAITCVDVHGTESFLSSQIQAQLNPSFEAERKEKLLKWISGAGVSPEARENSVILKKFRDAEKPTIAKRNIVIAPTEQYNDVNKNLLIRVTSLDNNEIKEFNINLKNIKNRKTEIERNT